MRLTPEGWAALVVTVLAEHPDWVALTVNATQEGVVEAIERQKDRALTLSTGLMEALNTRPGAKRRVSQRIIDAVQVSHFHPTPWSKKMIERENKPKGGEAYSGTND